MVHYFFLSVSLYIETEKTTCGHVSWSCTSDQNGYHSVNILLTRFSRWTKLASANKPASLKSSYCWSLSIWVGHGYCSSSETQYILYQIKKFQSVMTDVYPQHKFVYISTCVMLFKMLSPLGEVPNLDYFVCFLHFIWDMFYWNVCEIPDKVDRSIPLCLILIKILECKKTNIFFPISYEQLQIKILFFFFWGGGARSRGQINSRSLAERNI